MKNDIKTSSTDFLPPKPGADPASTPVTDTSSLASADDKTAKAAPAAAPAPKPANPLMPTSAHVIDLKNQSDQPKPAAAKDSNEFMVKNNPFLQGTDKTDQTKPVVKTVPLEVSGDGVKKPSDLPEPPKAEPAVPDKTAVEVTKAESSKTDSTVPPTVDLAHSDAANTEASDPLKDAMVSDEEGKTKKPKKKLPTWLLVLIIVVAVILIAVGTFVVLNIVARPTGV